jgi:hypothetical protein
MSHPEATVFRGHAGVLKSLDQDVAAFEGIRYQPHEFVAVGDHVMVPMRQTGRGKTSGVLIEEDIVTVWKLAEARRSSRASTGRNGRRSTPWG